MEDEQTTEPAPAASTEGADATAASEAAQPSIAEQRLQALRELKEERAEEVAHRRFAPTRSIADEAKEEPTSDEASDDSGEPEGTARPKEEAAAADKKPADAKKEDDRPVTKEELRRAAAQHQRELRARDREVTAVREQLTALQRQNQELSSFRQTLEKDPLKALVDSGVDLQRLVERLVVEKPDVVLGQPKDPRDAAIDELRAELAEIRKGAGLTKEQKEQQAREQQAQQERQQKESDWRVATDYVVTNKDEFPFMHALGQEGVQHLIDSFYEYARLYPDQARQAGSLAVVAKAAEEVMAERERERHGRISRIVGAPATGSPPGDGQKKPEDRKGQKGGEKGSKVLSSEGSTPFKGSGKKPVLDEDEKLELAAKMIFKGGAHGRLVY